MGYFIGSLAVYSFTLVGDTSLCVYSSSVWVIIPIVLFLLICKRVRKYFITAYREVVRLEAVSRSPIVSFFTESLNGLTSIRAYGHQQRMLKVSSWKGGDIPHSFFNISNTAIISMRIARASSR